MAWRGQEPERLVCYFSNDQSRTDHLHNGKLTRTHKDGKIEIWHGSYFPREKEDSNEKSRM
jgi:hypothetical protein